MKLPDQKMGYMCLTESCISVMADSRYTREITLTLMPKQLTGKNTFHSMARVFLQNQQVNEQTSDSVNIPVGSDKSLKLTETECVKLTQSLSFEKPKQRPRPNRKTNAN